MISMKWKHLYQVSFPVLSIIAVLFLTGGKNLEPGKIVIHNGDKIAFLGDSITQFGTERPNGYVNLVLAGLKTLRIEVKPIFAGVSGNQSNDMLARIDNSVIAHHPDWMLLSCGVNDIWHGAEDPTKGVELPAYKVNMTQMIDMAQAAGIKVGLMSITVCTENPEDPRNLKVALYNDFLRQLALKKKCLRIDVGSALRNEIAIRAAAGKTPGKLVTEDGVHMNALGNMIMAEAILRAWGADNTDMNNIYAAWKKIPGTVKR